MTEKITETENTGVAMNDSSESAAASETATGEAGKILETISKEDKKKNKTPGIEEVQKIVEQMLEKAAKSANEIIENATKQAALITNGAVVAATVTADENANDLDELVTVQLFKDGYKYKDDVFVAVNGESLLIQRGKPVRIKKKFAIALEQSQRQDEYTALYSEGLQDEFLEKEAAGKL